MPGSALVTAVVAALGSDLEVAVVRDRARWVVGVMPERVVTADGTDAFAALDGIRDGWWAGFLTYELGHAVERVRPRPDGFGDDRLPDLRFARFDARLVIDGDRIAVDGDGETRALLKDAAQRALATDASGTHQRDALATGPWRSSLDRAEFAARVSTIIEHIEAGDCYQVNLTRRLVAPEPADPVALFGALARQNPAPHAAMIRTSDLAFVSASPEQFLRRDGDLVTTRPIKGTAAAGAAGEAALVASEKDHAENVMIVDLSRNDLGRVCAFGTVAVDQLCAVEHHPGLTHLVSSVHGTIRPGLGLGALLRATYPPASITGAPKPRVMQLIEDLEPIRRGVYCGAIGWIDGDHHVADLNVAIRTFTITPNETQLGVGAGIVADSDAASEWNETELKAARLLHAAGAKPVAEVGS